jgi:hypothetical protein
VRLEREVWAALKRALPPGLMVRRIEDMSGNLGTWDTWIGCRGWGMWIELKCCETAKRKPKLRPGQYAFGLDLERADVPGCYIVGSGDGKVRVLNRLYDGDDWVKAIEDEWTEMDREKVLGLLQRFGLPH